MKKQTATHSPRSKDATKAISASQPKIAKPRKKPLIAGHTGDLRDRICGEAGSHIATLADSMVKTFANTTLLELAAELELGLDVISGMIDEYGDSALITTPYSDDE